MDLVCQFFYVFSQREMLISFMLLVPNFPHPLNTIKILNRHIPPLLDF